jgi:ABC-type phosphate transport system permease subunit
MSANAPPPTSSAPSACAAGASSTAFVEGARPVAALLAVAVLVIVVRLGRERGWGALNLDFFTKTPALYTGFGPRPASGIATAIIGTLIIIGLALLMALPVADA